MIFPELQKQARLRLLKMHFEAKVGHIGGNLSSLYAMLYLHHNVMQKKDISLAWYMNYTVFIYAQRFSIKSS